MPEISLAICGKGGVGKTAVSALLARSILDLGVSPLLLVDADPAGGLVSAIGEHVESSLSAARENLIESARNADDKRKDRLASELDYYVMEALVEKEYYSLLAMGHNQEKGCFCPANTLLRAAVDNISASFRALLIDAEAGLEQINRQVTRKVEQYIVVIDGSQRSIDTLSTMHSMLEGKGLAVIANRCETSFDIGLPSGVEMLGFIPEDAELKSFDRKGTSLWSLKDENPAMYAAREIAVKLRNGK